MSGAGWMCGVVGGGMGMVRRFGDRVGGEGVLDAGREVAVQK